MRHTSFSTLLRILLCVPLLLLLAGILFLAYAQRSYTYTLNADWAKGALNGVEYTSVPNQLQLSQQPGGGTLPLLWVPNTNQGSISKMDADTGRELGRYRVISGGGEPTRTTVDQQGNCWVGLRTAGTAVKVGLSEAGQCVDRNRNGVIETSTDSNGDGDISGAEFLDWGKDECVLYEVVLIQGKLGTYEPGKYTAGYADNKIRAVAVDLDNNIWVASFNDMRYYRINNSNGQIIQQIDTSKSGHRPYGAVIDKYGTLWSSGSSTTGLASINTSTGEVKIINQNLLNADYGIALDRLDHIFTGDWGGSRNLHRINTVTKTVDFSLPVGVDSRGIAVTPADNNVWVVTGDSGAARGISRYSNAGSLIKFIPIEGDRSTGAAVDNKGKVWVVHEYDGWIYRIDPATNAIDLKKEIKGTTHYSYSDMTGSVVRNFTTMQGTWRVTHDSGSSNSSWGTISWTAGTPAGTSVSVSVRGSEDQINWSDWESARNAVPLCATRSGRYLQIEAKLQTTDEKISPILYDLTVNVGSPGPCVGNCDYFNEGFSGSPDSNWGSFDGSGGPYAKWSWLNGKLDADQVQAGKSSWYGGLISAPDLFTLDVDIEVVSLASGAFYAVEPFSSTAYPVPFMGQMVDGVGAMVFSSGNAYLVGWSSSGGVQSSAFAAGGNVTSIGVQFTSSAVILRINKANTSLSVPGSYTAAIMKQMDFVGFLVRESGTHIRFDNVCITSQAGSVTTTTSAVTSTTTTTTTTTTVPPTGSVVITVDCPPQVAPNSQVTVPIRLTSNAVPGVASFEVELVFNTAQLTYVSVAAGPSAVAANKRVQAVQVSAGRYRFAVSALNQEIIPNGIVMNVVFQISASVAGGTKIPITCDNLYASDPASKLIPAQCASGGCNITVISKCDCDVNKDGRILINDVQLITNMILGVVPATCDVNGDGSVDVTDRTIVLNAVLDPQRRCQN